VNTADLIALGALMIALLSALGAFIYWLLSISYKVSKFIFDLKGDVTEIKQNMYDHKAFVSNLNRKVKYITYIVKQEFPQYFKREEDKEDESDN
jgi:uncharacterized membrane protein